MKAAIYARYSTNLQNESSIEDQVALCRDYAGRERLEVVRVFSDAGISGASLVNRPGVRDLLAAATAGEFQTIIVFDLYRLSRDMEDLAGIHKRLNHAGVQLRAVHEGAVNTVLIGLRGLTGQLYREDNANNIRRAGVGRVKRGLAGGGLTYGYAPVPGEPGKRVIVETEAAIVRRVMAEYLGGATPRNIAAGLNRDRIPAPRGDRWMASTINGSKRGAGMLANEIYCGRIVWNRVRMMKHPDTGRRISRPNPREEWITKDVPELAIVSPETFAAVQARREARSNEYSFAHTKRRPRHMLSGLLRCAACGGGMSTCGGDKTGRRRIHCTTHRESKSCSDPQTFYLETVETIVLKALRAELRKPERLTEYVKAYHEERKRLAAGSDAARSRIDRRLGEIEREMKRTIDLMVTSPPGFDVTDLRQRSQDLATERQQLTDERATLPAATPNVVTLHPAILARYEQQLDALQATTAKGTERGDSGGANALRELVQSVTVRRGERKGSVVVDIEGPLDALIEDRPRSAASVRGAFASAGLVVAEDGFEPPTHGL